MFVCFLSAHFATCYSRMYGFKTYVPLPSKYHGHTFHELIKKVLFCFLLKVCPMIDIGMDNQYNVYLADYEVH